MDCSLFGLLLFASSSSFATAHVDSHSAVYMRFVIVFSSVMLLLVYFSLLLFVDAAAAAVVVVVEMMRTNCMAVCVSICVHCCHCNLQFFDVVSCNVPHTHTRCRLPFTVITAAATWLFWLLPSSFFCFIFFRGSEHFARIQIRVYINTNGWCDELSLQSVETS